MTHWKIFFKLQFLQIKNKRHHLALCWDFNKPQALEIHFYIFNLSSLYMVFFPLILSFWNWVNECFLLIGLTLMRHILVHFSSQYISLYLIIVALPSWFALKIHYFYIQHIACIIDLTMLHSNLIGSNLLESILLLCIWL
jgi:hypothetical protein